MIEATSISVSYNEHEDRLLADCTDGRSVYHLVLTRRITQRLLSAFVDLLERSSLAMTRSPADMRMEVIAFEHQSAISQPQTPAGAAQPRPPLADLGTVIVAKVDVQVHSAAFRLLFHSPAEPAVGLSITRADFHRILAALDRYAMAAEWNIGSGTVWLTGGQIAASNRIAS